MSEPSTITELLIAWNGGDASALNALVPMVEKQLRRLAARQMRGERPNHTLQTTGLVNEAYMRLARQAGVRWQDRAHFYAIASKIMRRVLLDYAKARKSAKRGGGLTQVELDEYTSRTNVDIDSMIELDEALARLAELDSVKCRVVELRYFGGLSVDETAEVLGVAQVTVMRHWRFAKAWLQRELRDGPKECESTEQELIGNGP